MAGFGKIKGGISLPATTALNSAVYGIYTAAEAEAYRKLGLWPTAPTTPGMPTNLVGTSGNSQVSLLWSAPAANGGAAITDYSVQYSSNSGSTWSTFSRSASTSTSALVTGLTNDTSYVFRVAAVNNIGTGSYTSASSSVTPLAAQPDAYFSSVALLLHGDGNVNDSSANNVPVTASGAVVSSATQSKWDGGSIYFPGAANDYLSVPAGVVPSGVDDFTIEGWIYPQSWSNSGALILQTGANGIQIGRYGSGDSWGIAQANIAWLISDVPFTALNTWTHIAVVRQSNTIKIYVNGTQAGSTYNGGVSFANLAGVIGGDTGGSCFQGYMDDFRITKGANSARYTSTFAPAAAAFSNYASLIAPAAPATLSGIPSDTAVTLSWPLPGVNGGPAITDYTVQYSSDSGSNWTTFSDGTSASRTATVTGLTNGVAHLFRVAATNSVGTGSYVTSGAITPAIIAALTIVTQPKNDYATASNVNITFSITTSGGGTPTYQWQYYGPDEPNDYYESAWRNIPSATASSYVTNGNTLGNLMSYEFNYTGNAKLRCVVTAEGGASTVTSDIVRFVELDYLHSAGVNWYGSQGSYVNYVHYTQPSTFSPAVGENLVLDFYDFAMGYPDTSWYTGNDTTLKIQVATDGYTDSANWTDLYTQDFRGTAYISGYNITPSTGTKYYRAILVDKWPYAVNNGTQSATRTPQHVYPNSTNYIVQVTWPAPPPLLSMTRSNNGGTITGWSGDGTAASPFTRSAGHGLSDFDGLTHYSWTAGAAATVTFVFDYSDDTDNGENYQLMRMSGGPPYAAQTGTSGNAITKTVSVIAGDVLFFSSTGDPSSQYFANVSVSATAT